MVDLVGSLLAALIIGLLGLAFVGVPMYLFYDENTPYGECIGLMEQGQEDPSLRYETDFGNVALAIVFSETLVVPALVLADSYKCPVGAAAQLEPTR